MPEIQKTTKSKGAVICLFGVPGVGKTRFISTGGDDTLIIRPPTDHTDAIEYPVDEVVVSSWPDLLTGNDSVWRNVQQARWSYKWYWLDSLSLFQYIGLRDLFDLAVERKPHRAEFGLDVQEYGINQFRIETFCRNMVGLAKEGKFNFGIVCHTMEWYDPVEERTLWSPNIQGKEGMFMQKILGMFNTVAYYYLANVNDERKRVLRTEAGDRDVFVKDQLGLAPKGRLIEPTMADIDRALASRNSQPKTTRRRRRRKKV